MKKEVTITAKSVDEAVEQGASQLGVALSDVTYEIVEEPKKGFLGIGDNDAVVRVCYVSPAQQNGLEFVRQIIRDMDIYADAAVAPVEGAKREYVINISGEDAGVLIGHHGETLDALQYLTNLAANRRTEDDDPEYTRISLDVEDYRVRREETLRRLAKRTAERALRTGTNITLEPMSPYERRIIHSEIQGIDGVTTNSIGVDSNRRVMVIVDGGQSGAGKSGKNRRKKRGSRDKRPAETKIEIDLEDEDYVPSMILGPITKREKFDDSLPEYHLGDSFTDEKEN